MRAPRTVLERTMLIGDAAFVRPHTAGSAAMAARDALAIATALTNESVAIDVVLASFEREQLP